MDGWLHDAQGGTGTWRAVPMTTNLSPIADGVNLLTLERIGYRDLESVNAWLIACSMTPYECHSVFCVFMDCGFFNFCNIEHRLEVVCRK